MNYKFAQLIQTPGKKRKTMSDVYIAQVDSQKEELAGKLFILTEINENTTNSLKIINFLTDSIVQNFYQNEKLLLREKMPGLKVEHIFEASLTKTNKQFTDFLKSSNKLNNKTRENSLSQIRINLKNINITAGVVFANELYLANTGKNNAFLIFPKDDTDHDFNIVNILKNKDEDNSKQKNTQQKKYRLFSNVISGQIPNGGSVFITNEALPEYISQKQLLSIISSLPPISAVEQIKNTLSTINTYVSFTGILVKNTIFEKRTEIPTINTKASHDSINSLNRTEDATEALLTPSGMISFKKWFKMPYFNRSKENKPSTPLLLKDKIHVKRKHLFNKPKLQILNFFVNISNALAQLVKNLNIKKIIQKFFNKLPNKNEFINLLKLKYRFLISKKKILLFISIFFLIAFFFNINDTKKNNNIEDNNQKYNELSQSIERKQNQAEANLIYSNDAGAKKLFDEISALLEELPQETEEQQRQYQDFKNKFDNQLEKIRRITRTDDSQEIIDFNNLNSRAQVENISYIPSTNKIYAADSSLKSIYIFDLFDKISTTITNLDDPIQQLKFPLNYKDGEKEQILYFNNDNIITVDTDENKFSTLNIDFENIKSIGGVGLYASKLYAVDTKEMQIYRFSKTSQGFNAPSPWLNKKIDLSQAISLSIDGHIYILNKNGTVLKLLRGEKTNFKLELCDPPLDEPNKIVVSNELDFIYILEAKNNRLVVFDKTGQFLMQYKSEKLNQLKDFAIDEDKKIIYFLNGSKIFKFNAIHFEQ